MAEERNLAPEDASTERSPWRKPKLSILPMDETAQSSLSGSDGTGEPTFGGSEV
ncbi:hypothetical protein [Oharaeibacter diazotrophicus]|uniref:hypothetical protein n=1 Tax=Oharaeibacter diazotrophicus TaxID=1920512 RepID=UPI0013F5FD1F|nr:hypothetical protein [Oharaeibacter diazotrophicus]GLS77291.1 hypothetical protein GCM10007904_26280 [Oharaeibacter diazotrophicus]